MRFRDQWNIRRPLERRRGEEPPRRPPPRQHARGAVRQRM